MIAHILMIAGAWQIAKWALKLVGYLFDKWDNSSEWTIPKDAKKPRRPF